MKSIAILGASGGIGAALLKALLQRSDVSDIYATYYLSTSARIDTTDKSGIAGNSADITDGVHVKWQQVDASSETQVAEWIQSVGQIDWLINCVGMLHDAEHGPEKTIAQFDVAYFNKSMAINCVPTLLLGKYARDVLKQSEQAVFATISARVGSISDNRLGGWYSYRASKAALNMVLKCLAIEWSRNAKGIRVAALHPGTTDSRLSKPFQQNVPEGKLFSTEKTAGLLLEQIDQLHLHPSGRFIAYDGEELPW